MMSPADKMFQKMGYTKSNFVFGLYYKSDPGYGCRKIMIREDGSAWVTLNGEYTCFTRGEIHAVHQKMLEEQYGFD